MALAQMAPAHVDKAVESIASCSLELEKGTAILDFS